MPTTRIKDKISRLVPGQLPEFIQSEYPTFVAFIKAYYEFLEQDQNAQELLQNARSYNDIDTTIDSFVQYFIKQYYDILPKELLVDKRALVKKINDLYASKGSVNSYKLLFKLLFNKNVDVKYPSLQVLKASDGKWIQKNSFYVQTISGDPDTIANSVVVIKNPTYEAEVQLYERRQVIEISTQGVYGVSPNKSEFFFNNNSNPPISGGDFVYAKGFIGVVLYSIGNISIVDGGSGFRVGDIINVDILRGTGAKLKVVKTGINGAIKNVQPITFGVNYPEEFFYNYTKIITNQVQASFEYAAPNITVRDNTVGIKDRGVVTKNDYSYDAFEGSYAGEPLATFKYDEGFYTSDADNVDAIFSIGRGIKNFYPGYFINNDGFLSDDIFLENEELYQPYAYQISIDEQLAKYKNAVMDIVHPAGKKLNADYANEVQISITQQVLSTLNALMNDLYDYVPVVDRLSMNISAVLRITTSVLDTPSLSISRPLSNVTSTTDELRFNLNKPAESIIGLVDSNVRFSASIVILSQTYSYGYFLEDYVVADGNDGVTMTDTLSVVKF